MGPNYPQPPAPDPAAPPPGRPTGWSTAPAEGSRRGGWRDFVMFRSMITPGLITIIWLIGFALITLWAVATVFVTDEFLAGLLAGILVWLIGNLYLRVILELMIVLFRIYSRLGDVERNTRPR